MGFYQVITLQFGNETATKLKQWANTNIKIASIKNRKIFLLNCRRRGIIPNHIMNNTRNVETLIDVHDGRTGQEINTFNKRLKIKILNLEIKITHGSLKTLERSLSQLQTQLENCLPADILNEFLRRQNIKYNKEFHEIKITNIRKLKALEQQNTFNIKIKDNWLKNLTDVVIPPDINIFLSLGYKFCIPPNTRDVCVAKLLADVELLISKFDNNKKNIFRARVTNVLTNYLHKPSSHNVLFFENIFNKTKKFLKEHAELIVTKSDKGNVTVLMTKNQYKDKALDILNDAQSYTKLNKDPTSTYQQKANKLVKDLFEDDMIVEQESKNLMLYNAVPAKFYGLPKIHKPTLSLRPIISSIDTPNSNIAQFITNILTISYDNNNEYFVKDSFQFAEFINEKQLPEGFVIISLDVVSLFSNIPRELVINSIKKRWRCISSYCNMSYDKFIEIIEFIFDTTYFTFDNIFYKQILGTPMGATVSPIVAQYVMDDLLDTCIPLLTFQLPFIKKYVDDIICSVPEEGIEEILLTFNNYNEHLKFTVEKENNGRVPFLDTEVIRKPDNMVILDWYIKPTSSGRYINYNSHHREKMKINLVLALKNRIHKISHTSLRNKNIDKLFNILIDNSYPPHLLRKLLYNTRIDNHIHNDNVTNETGVSTFYSSIPYIKEVSPRIVNFFKHEKDIKIAQRNTKYLGLLYTKLKDKDNPNRISNVIYNIPCQNCQMKYIGQTSRSIGSRITSHKSDCNLKKRSCALAEHNIDTGHHLDYNNYKILHREKNFTKRLFLEMVEINLEPHSMNKRTDISDLSNIYSFVLSLDKNPPDISDISDMSE